MGDGTPAGPPLQRPEPAWEQPPEPQQVRQQQGWVPGEDTQQWQAGVSPGSAGVTQVFPARTGHRGEREQWAPQSEHPGSEHLGQERRDPDAPIYHMRTHPKVLFLPVVLTLALLAGLVVDYLFIPGDWLAGKARLVAAGILLLVGGRYVLFPALSWWCKTYTITSHAIVKKKGILWKSSYTIPIARITKVSTERGILDRIFRCGTLIVSEAAAVPGGQPAKDEKSAGTPLRDIPQVLTVESTLNRLIHDRQTGMQPGS